MAIKIATTTEIIDDPEGEKAGWGVLWHGVRYGGRFYVRQRAEVLAETLDAAPDADHAAWRERMGKAEYQP